MKYANCPLFDGIPENEIKLLLNCLRSHEVKFNEGSEIWSYSQKSGVFGMILSGRADVKKLDRNGNYTILESLSKYGVFSDSFAYTATDANYISIYATEPCTVLMLETTEIFKRCKNACKFHSTFVENLYAVVVQKTKTLSQRVEILSNKTICDKILSYASLMLSNKNTKTFNLPMSYTSLAQYLCVDRSALMRELKKLSDKGILKVNKKEITVLSSEYI